MSDFNIVLVTGQMRSGTTFTANFLNSQNDIFIFSDLLVSLFNGATSLNIKSIHKALSEQEKNILMSNLEAEGLNRGIDFGLINRKKIHTWKDIFFESHRILKKIENVSIIGVKSTKADKLLNELINDGVKIIYCYRDPRDVIYSAQNRFVGVNVLKYSMMWKHSIQNIKNYIGFKNVFFLKYEEFILDSKKVCYELTEFLDVNVDSEIKEKLKHGFNKGYINNSAFGDVNKLFDSSAVFRWKNKIVSTQNQEIGYLLRKDIKELGYEKTSTKISVNKKIQFELSVLFFLLIISMKNLTRPILNKIRSSF